MIIGVYTMSVPYDRTTCRNGSFENRTCGTLHRVKTLLAANSGRAGQRTIGAAILTHFFVWNSSMMSISGLYPCSAPSIRLPSQGRGGEEAGIAGKVAGTKPFLHKFTSLIEILCSWESDGERTAVLAANSAADIYRITAQPSRARPCAADRRISADARAEPPAAVQRPGATGSPVYASAHLPARKLTATASPGVASSVLARTASVGGGKDCRGA